MMRTWKHRMLSGIRCLSICGYLLCFRPFLSRPFLSRRCMWFLHLTTLLGGKCSGSKCTGWVISRPWAENTSFVIQLTAGQNILSLSSSFEFELKPRFRRATWESRHSPDSYKRLEINLCIYEAKKYWNIWKNKNRCCCSSSFYFRVNIMVLFGRYIVSVKLKNYIHHIYILQ